MCPSGRGESWGQGAESAPAVSGTGQAMFDPGRAGLTPERQPEGEPGRGATGEFDVD
jgi:hypothetical protein